MRTAFPAGASPIVERSDKRSLNSYLRRFGRRVDNPKLRLFCFHCAGGSASEFRLWNTFLPADVELIAIQLPGREERYTEALRLPFMALVQELTDAMTPLLDIDCVFFGHSLGAILSFEVIRELQRRAIGAPQIFFPAGREAPLGKSEDSAIHLLPNQEFAAALRQKYPGTLGPILASPELAALYLPILRADFRLVETYHYQDSAPIDCPIYALAGDKEFNISDTDLASWSMFSSAWFKERRFPGDHFFIRSSQRLVLNLIVMQIERLLRRPSEN